MPRPKLPSGKKRNVRVMVNLRPREYRALMGIANGEPLGRLLRECALKKVATNLVASVESAQG